MCGNLLAPEALKDWRDTYEQSEDKAGRTQQGRCGEAQEASSQEAPTDDHEQAEAGQQSEVRQLAQLW